MITRKNACTRELARERDRTTSDVGMLAFWRPFSKSRVRARERFVLARDMIVVLAAASTQAPFFLRGYGASY